MQPIFRWPAWHIPIDKNGKVTLELEITRMSCTRNGIEFSNAWNVEDVLDCPPMLKSDAEIGSEVTPHGVIL